MDHNKKQILPNKRFFLHFVGVNSFKSLTLLRIKILEQSIYEKVRKRNVCTTLVALIFVQELSGFNNWNDH